MSETNYNVINAGDGAFIKAWTEGVPVEEDAQEQLQSRRAYAVHAPLGRGDARRALGKGRDGRQRDPHRRRDHPGRGRRRHRLRHDRGADDAQRARSARHAARACARRSRRRCRMAAPTTASRARQSRRVARPAVGARRAAWADARTPATTSIVAQAPAHRAWTARCSTSERSAPATTSSRCASTRTDDVWFMLHWGSRGVGNRIGTLLHRAGQGGHAALVHQPARPGSRLPARRNASTSTTTSRRSPGRRITRRSTAQLMMEAVRRALCARREAAAVRGRVARSVNCHHNYVAREHHFGKNVLVTRKGAVRARLGDLGIIPGSMGARSYIVRGLGNARASISCSHGAGRAMSRTAAKTALHAGRPRGGHGGHRVPQGRGRDRRDARRPTSRSTP